MAIDTEKQFKRQNEWLKENTERISFVMPVGTKERIQRAAYNQKISASEYIRQAIFKALEKDKI